MIKFTKELSIAGEHEDGSALLSLELLSTSEQPHNNVKLLKNDYQDKRVVMGIYCAAYFNLGVSFEHLRHFKLSRQAHERGLAMCYKYLPEKLPLQATFQQTIENLHVKEKTVSERFISQQIARQTEKQSQMVAPLTLRQQVERASLKSNRRYQTLDAQK